jgi:hypothetical protein
MNAAHSRQPGNHSHAAIPVAKAAANHSGSCARSRSRNPSIRPEIAENRWNKKDGGAGSSGASTVLGALVQSIGYFREEESAYQRKRQN